MKTLISYILLLTPIFYSGSLLAQEQSTPENASSRTSTTLPTEIIVTPLMNRRDLRSLITKVEKDFVKRFNELNIDDNYDIDCYKYSATTTHIRKDVCEPQFFKKARAADASLAGFNLSQAANVIQLEAVQVQTDRGLRQGLGREYRVLQQKIAELTNSDEALKTIIDNLNELNHSLKNYGKDN